MIDRVLIITNVGALSSYRAHELGIFPDDRSGFIIVRLYPFLNRLLSVIEVLSIF